MIESVNIVLDFRTFVIFFPLSCKKCKKKIKYLFLFKNIRMIVKYNATMFICVHTHNIYTYIYLYMHILRHVFYIKQIKHYTCIYGWFTLLCCWKIAFAMTSGFSWQNSVSLCPISFWTLRLKLQVITGISWLPTFAFQSPMVKRTSFWVLVLEGLVGLHKTFNSRFFSISDWGMSLGYYHVERFALEMNGEHSVIFEITHKHWIGAVLLTLRTTPFLPRDSCQH